MSNILDRETVEQTREAARADDMLGQPWAGWVATLASELLKAWDERDRALAESAEWRESGAVRRGHTSECLISASCTCGWKL